MRKRDNNIQKFNLTHYEFDLNAAYGSSIYSLVCQYSRSIVIVYLLNGSQNGN